MKKYGYLEETSTDTEALYSEAGLKDVIRTVQKFGAISETGVIDNATIKVMCFSIRIPYLHKPRIVVE